MKMTGVCEKYNLKLLTYGSYVRITHRNTLPKSNS